MVDNSYPGYINVNPSQGNDPDRTNETIARALAGATPALMGFLMGAKPAMAAHQIAQEQQFYKNGTPNKLVTVVGSDGVPVYEDSRMAVGETPYQKPIKINSSGTIPKPAQFYNPDSGKNESGYWDPLKKTYFNGAQVAVPNAQPFSPTVFKEAETAGGTKVNIPLNPTIGSQFGSQIKGPAGEADLKGQGKQQYSTSLDLSKQFPKEIEPIQQKIHYADATLKLLSNPDKTIRTQGAIQAQQYLQEAKADKTLVNIVSPGSFDKLIEIAGRMKDNVAGENETNALISTVQQIASAQKDSINTIAKTTKQAAGPEAKKMMDNNIYVSPQYTPKQPPIQPSQHTKTPEMLKKASDILANKSKYTEDEINDAITILKINRRR